jgi:hypothetical protein
MNVGVVSVVSTLWNKELSRETKRPIFKNRVGWTSGLNPLISFNSRMHLLFRAAKYQTLRPPSEAPAPIPSGVAVHPGAQLTL